MQQQDMSMEEILASIRKIISEDKTAPPAGLKTSPASGPRAPGGGATQGGDILDLRNEVKDGPIHVGDMGQKIQVDASVTPHPGGGAQGRTARPSPPLKKSVAPSAEASDAQTRPAYPESPMMRVDPKARTNPAPASSRTGSMSAQDFSLDTLLMNALQPVLRQWLDVHLEKWMNTHLPQLAEDMLRKQMQMAFGGQRR